MRYAVLSFPRLPIQLARRANPVLSNRPTALVRGEGDGALLSAVSVEATADGVEPGMTSLQARQRCPGIELAPDQPERELAALDGVVEMIRIRATPNVAILSRSEIAVELEGTDRQFSDETSASAALLGLVRSWSGLDVRCAVASSITEAACAARTARRFAVICQERDVDADHLPRYEPLAASFSWQVPAAGEAVDSRLGRLLGSLEVAADAHAQSYREIVLELEHGPYRRAFVMRPEQPLHTSTEALTLLRRRIPVAELSGATSVRVTLSRPGPDLRVEPWRSPVATIHQMTGPAVPVQRRLLRAS